ncbi:hypothetical protein V497_00600 [Pseudogymnoascus sp. VKM F-4516 (FW-969)]|nr:hypothetical protein V497_00600 [Pseudogymnoascus sp. VKM F-4516 (FW-969)]
MKTFFTTFFLATMATSTFAHMEMSDPPPLRSKFNKNADPGSIDYSMTSPLDASGSDFACKGFLSDLETAGGASVATWAAGSQQKFTITGGAAHNGGSCQASLSTDKGKTFKVIHSYIGNCPLVPDYKFTVPSDTPAGAAVFAWTWFNKVGNREMYMNCASVTITAGSGTPAVAFSARPALFEANIGNGCTVLESSDVQFPDPGPDADVTKDSAGTAAPVGSCGSSGGASSGGGSDSPSGNTGNTGAPASVVAPQAPTTMVTSIIPSSTNTGQSGSTNPKTPTGPLKASTNGECGGTQTCTGSTFGNCCSKWGYCGTSSEHCGEGCDPTLGTCPGASSGAATGAAKATGKVAVSNLADTKAAAAAGKIMTKTETEVVYSTVYVTDGGKAAATGAAGAAQAGVNNVGGRVTFVTSTKAETEPRNVITVIPVPPN